MRGQLVAGQVCDRLAPQTGADDAVVVEDGDAVGRQPDVALQSRSAVVEGHPERLEGVLRGKVPGAAMSKADWRLPK